MRLEHKAVDGDVQIRDEETDSRDIMCIIPLTGDADYDAKILMPFVKAVCALPQLATASIFRLKYPSSNVAKQALTDVLKGIDLDIFCE